MNIAQIYCIHDPKGSAGVFTGDNSALFIPDYRRVTVLSLVP